MNHYEKVQSEACEAHGVFTYKRVKLLGIRSSELARWVKRGRITKVGHGVYRLNSFPAQGIVSNIAALLAEVGENAYLYGESVLGFLELCPTRSYVAQIATASRCRRKLPDGVQLIHVPPGYQPDYPMGIACQHVEDAILSSVGRIEGDRLHEAVQTAREKGYFTDDEANELEKRIDNGRTTEE